MERGHLGVGGAQVFAFGACNVGDRAQDDGRGKRQLERQRGQPAGAARRAGRADQQLVPAVRSGARLAVIHGGYGDLQGALDGLPGGFHDDRTPALGQQVQAFLDRCADGVAQPRREARVFEQALGEPQVLQL
jgi:hypothetical protein